MDILFTGLMHSFSEMLSKLAREQGYLDPGSGSYIIQLILASVMGALFMLGVYRKKVSDFFRNLFSKKSNDDEPDE
jgi:hypothetical protein